MGEARGEEHLHAVMRSLPVSLLGSLWKRKTGRSSRVMGAGLRTFCVRNFRDGGRAELWWVEAMGLQQPPVSWCRVGTGGARCGIDRKARAKGELGHF